ncbi:MAG: TonB family protein [Gammaproteobacteria bacterium]|jgi:protein TonB
MTETVLWGVPRADNPARRLVWTVPLALLLVLLALLAVGRLISLAPKKPHHERPVEARIYELPSSKASAPSRASRGASAGTATPSRSGTQAAARSEHSTAAHSRGRASHASQLVHQGRLPRQAAQAATHQGQPTHHTRQINWAGMNGQINSAVSSVLNRASFAQVHDPHTLVAHYYLATVLRALQRTGDMNYPGQLTGEPVVTMVIDSQGELVALRLVNSSGNDRLDRAAEQIVRQTAPFPPFPAALEKRTPRLKLTINMKFRGNKNLLPE